MGNYRSGMMGNKCWCVMVVNSQSSGLGNRGVRGNSRGSVHNGVASNPMVDVADSMADMADSMGDVADAVADMADSMGDKSGRCMHSGMPDPMRDNWSNGNSRGN